MGYLGENCLFARQSEDTSLEISGTIPKRRTVRKKFFILWKMEAHFQFHSETLMSTARHEAFEKIQGEGVYSKFHPLTSTTGLTFPRSRV
jgi:hypothetical protein